MCAAQCKAPPGPPHPATPWRFVVFGLLVGVIAIQWAIPAAQGNPEVLTAEILTVKAIRLVNHQDELIGILGSHSSDGSPVLTLMSGEAKIRLSVIDDKAELWAHSDGGAIYLAAEELSTSIRASHGKAGLSLSADDKGGSTVMAMYDQFFSSLKADESSSSVQTTTYPPRQ